MVIFIRAIFKTAKLVAKELLLIQKAPCTWDSGKTINITDTELKRGTTTHVVTKANLLMVARLELEELSLAKTIMMDNLKMERCTAKENSFSENQGKNIVASLLTITFQAQG